MDAGEDTELLRSYLPPDRLRQVLAAFGQHQVGDICRWDGERWEALTGPGAEKDNNEAFGALNTRLSALATLRGMDTSDITLPGSAERWEEHLLAADATLALVLEELEAALNHQHSRGTDADAYRDPDLLNEMPEAPEDES